MGGVRSRECHFFSDLVGDDEMVPLVFLERHNARDITDERQAPRLGLFLFIGPLTHARNFIIILDDNRMDLSERVSEIGRRVLKIFR